MQTGMVDDSGLSNSKGEEREKARAIPPPWMVSERDRSARMLPAREAANGGRRKSDGVSGGAGNAKPTAMARAVKYNKYNKYSIYNTTVGTGVAMAAAHSNEHAAVQQNFRPVSAATCPCPFASPLASRLANAARLEARS